MKPQTGLPRHLADQLSAEEQKALRNPRSRQILRALRGQEKKCSPSELVRQGKSPCALPGTAYYMRALEVAGFIKSDGVGQIRGIAKHYFSAPICGDSPALRVLAVTEKADQEHLASVEN